jgi:hypothetical protein
VEASSKQQARQLIARGSFGYCQWLWIVETQQASLVGGAWSGRKAMERELANQGITADRASMPFCAVLSNR